jgi:hypothetical protein
VLLVPLPLMSRGALSLFHNILTYDKEKLFSVKQFFN